MNGFTNVAPENVERVQKAAEALGYQKCEAAGLLRSRRKGSSVRSGNIGVVFSGMTGGWANQPMFVAYAGGIEQSCQEMGFHALIEFCEDGVTVPRCVRERKVDGILVKTTRGLPEFLKKIPSNLPVVSFGFNDPSASIFQVSIDNQGAGWMVADYLWQKGHRRIGFLSTDLSHPVFNARLHGYQNFLLSKGAFDPALVAGIASAKVPLRPDEVPPNMTGLLEHILSQGTAAMPTALVAENDWLACGLYSALAEKGIRVPQDISVVGFDNSEMLCNSMIPPLTTFAAPFAAVARTAAEELMNRIGHPERARDNAIQLLRGNIVERDSVRSVENQSETK